MVPENMRFATAVEFPTRETDVIVLGINACLMDVSVAENPERAKACYVLLPPDELRRVGITDNSLPMGDMHGGLVLYTESESQVQEVVDSIRQAGGPPSGSYEGIRQPSVLVHRSLPITRYTPGESASACGRWSFMNNHVGIELEVAPAEGRIYSFTIDRGMRGLDVRPALSTEPEYREVPGVLPGPQILRLLEVSVQMLLSLGLDGRSPLTNVDVKLKAFGWNSCDPWPLCQQIAVYRGVRECMRLVLDKSGMVPFR